MVVEMIQRQKVQKTVKLLQMQVLVEMGQKQKQQKTVKLAQTQKPQKSPPMYMEMDL